MTRKRANIDRRLWVAPNAPVSCSDDVVIAFRDGWGNITQVFDLNRLGLSASLTVLLTEAFRASYGGVSAESLKGHWKALRTFARFAHEDGVIAGTEDLTSEAVGRYLAWLDKQRSPTGEPWGISTRYGRYQTVRILLLWAMRNRADVMPNQLQFPTNPFPGRHKTPVPRRLPAAELKAILRACYAEIDVSWERFEEGRSVIDRQSMAESSYDIELQVVLVEAGRTGGGIMPWQEHGTSRRGTSDVLRRLGGTRRVTQYMHLTVDTLVPFFLAIAIQTAANPDALRNIGRDCLTSHPLDTHRVIVDWAKPRAGNTVRRAQRRTYDRRRQYSVPNLIEKVLAMSSPLVEHAPANVSDRLFLIRGNRPRGVGVIGNHTLDAGIRRFIARSNQSIAAWNAAHPEQLRSPMRAFAPVMFRGSVATEHYHAAGGDILAAQAILNHAHVNTTDLYVRGPETQRMFEKTISNLQHRMIGWIAMRDESPGPEIDGQIGGAAIGPAEAFSHICINPLVGKAVGSTRGRLCPGFMGCLTCPGLVIPIDSQHLARILQVMRKLEAARGRLDADRWRLIYAPGYRILGEEILPDFPANLFEAAELMISALPPLPDLE